MSDLSTDLGRLADAVEELVVVIRTAADAAILLQPGLSHAQRVVLEQKLQRMHEASAARWRSSVRIVDLEDVPNVE